ncbi:hypothetical protein QAD02_002410 [Eretmocerus hayati]|uniref:Uncharacterized protein n=1 Tax=Eretmocerus hayati TaxID=131215 RepID=A0ACC2NJ77_9HYME|nr:hypothetical protein QAD02_002410 [Eretmocerus hayati]
MTSHILLDKDFFKLFDLKIVEIQENEDEILNIDVSGSEHDERDVFHDLVMNPQISLRVQTELRNFSRRIEIESTRPGEPETHEKLKIRSENEQSFFYKPRKLSFAEKIKVKKITDDLLEKKNHKTE